MKPRQTGIPKQWLIADDRLGERLWDAVQSLPRGSGLLILYRDQPKRERAKVVAKLRRQASRRGLMLVDESAGESARVHNPREIRNAALRGARLLFLSPIFPTSSHPDWRPLPRMRAAAMLRLAKAPAIALGGMDERRFARVRRLGFHGWAGIDAWFARKPSRE